MTIAHRLLFFLLNALYGSEANSVSPPYNAKGTAIPTALLVEVDSSWDDLS